VKTGQVVSALGGAPLFRRELGNSRYLAPALLLARHPLGGELSRTAIGRRARSRSSARPGARVLVSAPLFGIYERGGRSSGRGADARPPFVEFSVFVSCAGPSRIATAIRRVPRSGVVAPGSRWRGSRGTRGSGRARFEHRAPCPKSTRRSSWEARTPRSCARSCRPFLVATTIPPMDRGVLLRRSRWERRHADAGRACPHPEGGNLLKDVRPASSQGARGGLERGRDVEWRPALRRRRTRRRGLAVEGACGS
jgi:hypothetical protein